MSCGSQFPDQFPDQRSNQQPPAVEVWSPNYWATREAPRVSFLRTLIPSLRALPLWLKHLEKVPLLNHHVGDQVSVYEFGGDSDIKSTTVLQYHNQCIDTVPFDFIQSSPILHMQFLKTTFKKSIFICLFIWLLWVLVIIGSLITACEPFVVACVYSSLIRDRTQAPCIGSVGSQPLDHQAGPKDSFLFLEQFQIHSKIGRKVGRLSKFSLRP